ncbi:tyrosine-type recombinase/integrase [Alicycliphilus denitrificans]|uniref:Integrase family protein n=1 Tax=Alicycliphilus denitrificans (strain DSM 14773 / CIP 107495 / K601) TaxID=596154 RepID=F4G7H9_ALIDK|nr:integrase arm-type DNA-binding domain-containing protein [Alicycliphilus denitrificans]AEB85509.1 integrase family protein [Alicycliphilus denitrificans K601]
MPTVPSRVRLTAARVESFACPPGKSQSFLWDTVAPALAVRATPTGRKTYTFESRLQGKTLRLSIGDVRAWTLAAAQAEATRLTLLVDSGTDPREQKRQHEAEQAAQAAALAAQAVTVGEAWAAYLADRRPHWGERHYSDHEALARAGGQPAARGTRGRGVTVAGPLHVLMSQPLRELTTPAIEAWAQREGQSRPTVARLAWRLLRAFMAWCSEHPDYRAAVPERNPAKSRRAREALGKPQAKDDALLKEQLPVWFAAVRAIRNPAQAAYLQALLLVGARPGELLGLQWQDVNTQWRGLTIRDKVEGERVIPLTPYVWHLLAGLPRRGQYVFAGEDGDKPMSKPHKAHASACAVAGIDGLTLHGLRRSFGTLSEWLELPAGVVAQIQGHKPSATAEKHYRVRPLDLLRLHHERLEAWILEQAGVQFDAQAEPGKLRAVV